MFKALKYLIKLSSTILFQSFPDYSHFLLYITFIIYLANVRVFGFVYRKGEKNYRSYKLILEKSTPGGVEGFD